MRSQNCVMCFRLVGQLALAATLGKPEFHMVKQWRPGARGHIYVCTCQGAAVALGNQLRVIQCQIDRRRLPVFIWYCWRVEAPKIASGEPLQHRPVRECSRDKVGAASCPRARLMISWSSATTAYRRCRATTISVVRSDRIKCDLPMTGRSFLGTPRMACHVCPPRSVSHRLSASHPSRYHGIGTTGLGRILAKYGHFRPIHPAV